MSTEQNELLTLRGVRKSFGPVQALDQISFSAPAGKVTALLGDNGAGKSVTIKTIAGLWQPDEGEILWRGQPLPKRAVRGDDQCPRKYKRAVVSAGLLHQRRFTQCTYPSASR